MPAPVIALWTVFSATAVAAPPGPWLEGTGVFGDTPSGTDLTDWPEDGALDSGAGDTGAGDTGAADGGLGGGHSGSEVGDTGFIQPECDGLRLTDGVQLPEAPELYTVWQTRNAWGSPRLIETLTLVAEEMRWQHPGADPLMVGDLSVEGGGWMRGHRSHRGGLDADVGIYWGQRRQYSEGLRTVRVDELDLDTNLAFIDALFATGNVERILLDRRLIRALRQHAIESGAMSVDEAMSRFILPGDGLEESPFSLDEVVHHVPGHHHHFHVRVRCER